MAKNLRGTRQGLAQTEAQDLRREQLTTHGMRSLPKLIDSGRLPEHLRTRQREILEALATPETCLSEIEQAAVKAVLLSEVGQEWLERQIAEGKRFEDLKMLKEYVAALNVARKMLETVYVLRSKAHGGALDLDAEMQRLAEKRAMARAAAADSEVIDGE